VGGVIGKVQCNNEGVLNYVINEIDSIDISNTYPAYGGGVIGECLTTDCYIKLDGVSNVVNDSSALSGLIGHSGNNNVTYVNVQNIIKNNSNVDFRFLSDSLSISKVSNVVNYSLDNEVKKISSTLEIPSIGTSGTSVYRFYDNVYYKYGANNAVSFDDIQFDNDSSSKFHLNDYRLKCGDKEYKLKLFYYNDVNLLSICKD
jgi:hypothetical protein